MAIDLFLPGLLRIGTGLTLLAASGLVIIMMGAAVLTPTLLGMDLIMALPNVVIGALRPSSTRSSTDKPVFGTSRSRPSFFRQFA